MLCPQAGAFRIWQVVQDEQLRAWMRDLISGLEHLFLHGICHRDVKPENLLWDAKAKCAKPADSPRNPCPSFPTKCQVREAGGLRHLRFRQVA